jgi:carotenoid cleavage dioxygenase
MKLLKLRRLPPAEAADRGRRSFFWKLGAGVSTALASTAGIAGTGPGDSDDLALQVVLLKEEQNLRRLHQRFGQAMDHGRYEDVIAMFADHAEVAFNGGVFAGQNQGISRLFGDRFRSGQTGRSMQPAPGFELAADQLQDSVEVSPNLMSATAVFPYSIQVGQPVESESSLASMARLQGGGVQTWWEAGAYRLTYARAAADGPWQIRRLDYNTLSRADYRSGRSYARPIAVAPLSACYPQDPQGPDALI